RDRTAGEGRGGGQQQQQQGGTSQAVSPQAIPDAVHRSERAIQTSQQRPGYISIKEFIRLMFFLSYASKEQLEETVFRIVSDGEDRQMEQLECTQAQPPDGEREREKMDEALLEANDLQSWSWTSHSDDDRDDMHDAGEGPLDGENFF
uniref:EF-hand domain-containing protein n=1 Tax=Macrostomum lignano TaxID=282301 RepID=A0A1I8FI39_9PLAT